MTSEPTDLTRIKFRGLDLGSRRTRLGEGAPKPSATAVRA